MGRFAIFGQVTRILTKMFSFESFFRNNLFAFILNETHLSDKRNRYKLNAMLDARF